MLLEHTTHAKFIVEGTDDVHALCREWSELWARCEDATPFQSPEWQLAWCEAFGSDKELCILALRDAITRELIALMPLCVLAREEKLMFIGAGVSDELDLLAPRAVREWAAELFVHEILTAHDRRWRVADLEPLPHSSPLRENARVCDVSPVLDLAQPLPKRIEQNVRYYRRRAGRLGSLEFRRAGPRDFDAVFDALIRFHTAWWNARGEPGVLCDAHVQTFHRSAARGLLERGMLRLYAMRIDREIVAALYGFLHRRRMFYYIGGFDPAHERISPGKLLLAHTIAEAKRERAREFNFLRGRESYKYLWGARDRFVYSRRLFA